MKSIILALLFTFSIGAKEINLFIIAGQSNAQGWKGDAAKYISDEIDQEIPLFYKSPGIGSSKEKWTTLGPQEGRFKTGHFGPEISFARSLKKAGNNTAIFKFTLGATSLAGKWKKPGEGGLYEQMIEQLKIALPLLEKKGYTVNPKALIWIQGEADSGSPKASALYLENLTLLINDLKKELKVEKLKVILGVDEQHPKVKQNPKVLNTLQSYANNKQDAIFTSMIGLKKADATHLAPESLHEHGQRIFEAYQKIK